MTWVCLKHGGALSKLSLNKLAPMLDKVSAGIVKAGKLAEDIAKDRAPGHV